MKKLFLILTIALTVMQLKAQQSIDANQMEQVIANPQAQIIDVRTPKEFKEGHLPNAENLDWKDQAAFLGQINDLNQNEPVYVYCLSGGRSQQAATLLAERGFTVHNYQGGMMDWRNSDKPEISDQDGKTATGLSTEEYDRIIASADLVLVSFTATWCVPCQELNPILDRMETDHADQLKLVRLDADENKSLTRVLNVRGLPQLMLYHQGKIVWAHAGLASEDEILQEVEKAIN